MAGKVVQMDYDLISEASAQFSTAADVLRSVGAMLAAVVALLRTEAFLSFGTNAALAQYVADIEQQVNNLVTICEDGFAKPLLVAIQDHQQGDVTGKHYFGRGAGA